MPLRRLQKPFVFAVCLVPLGLLVWRAFAGNLGANPIEAITHATGDWTLRFLLITLAVTPLRRLSGWNRLIGFRRMLGLFAFCYGTLHLLTYLWLDKFFDWPAILHDIPKRPFIDLLEKVPRIALRMLGSMSKWLKRMTDLVESLALRDVETRLVFFVSEELKSRGVPLADGVVLELEFGKNVLASRLGTVPETFSRTLKKLQEEGKIRVKGRQIRVLSADRLFASLAR